MSPLLAQQTSGQGFRLQMAPLLEDYGIPLAIMGILVVFAALVLVSLFIKWLPRLMATLDRYAPDEKEMRLAAAAKARRADELPAETLVVIAAAVAETISQPHRIIHTRALTPEELSWSLGGRIQHHTSHSIRQRDHR